jgi:hypothetical protein
LKSRIFTEHAWEDKAEERAYPDLPIHCLSSRTSS